MDVVFGYTKYDEALNEKSERVMIEDTAKATTAKAIEMRSDSTPPPV